MKYEDIKRKLVTEIGMATAAVIVLVGFVYYMTTLVDDYEKEKGDLQTQVASVTNERQTLENKYQKIQSNIDLYRDLMEKSENDGLMVDRQALREKIEEFKTRYFLNDLSITMGPVQELTGDKYHYKSNVMVSSELTIDFDTLSDEDIFSFLQSLQNELAGGLKVTRFTISRQNKVTDEGLRTIAKNGQYSMVKGETKFVWMGIKAVDQDAPAPVKKGRP
jgi:hypothetical protein